MAKKSKKKKYYSYYLSHKKGSKKKDMKKKGKAGKKSAYSKPKTVTVHPSLSKKDAKEMRKIILEPVDVPEKFIKRRNKCNHADGTISVAEFRAMSPTYAAFTPVVEHAVSYYGEDNVRICAHCYDVVVTRDAFSINDAKNAMVMLYMACNTLVANRRMDKSEIKKINKLKKELEKFNPVLRMLMKIEAKATSRPPQGSDPVSSLNRNPGAVYSA